MKKLFVLFIALVMLLSAAAVQAESKISVSGTGEVRVSADTAVISLGVNARDKDVLKAQQKVNESIAAIRTALIEQGVSEENINTEFINIYVSYDYQNDQETVEAYNASSTLAIKVTEMDKVGALIDSAFASGANTLNGISFSASDTAEAEAEALQEAVADAKKKADILAEASGLKITGIETLSEDGVYSFENNVGNVYGKMAAADAAAGGGTVVQAARLVINASVSITYSAE